MTQLHDSHGPDAETNITWPSPSVVVESAAIPRRSRGDRRNAVVVVWVLLIATGVVAAARVVSSDHVSTDNAAPTPTTLVVEGDRPPELDKRLDVAKVVSTISPSVVKVSVDINNADGSGEGVGTGLILSADGEIVTNAHVVLDASTVRVLLPGSTEPTSAKVIGTDSGNDLALLRVQASGLPVAHFAAPDSARVGDQVVAMGFALDLPGEASVTAGIISALAAPC